MTENNQASELWNKCLTFIQDNLGNDHAFNTVFGSLRAIKYENGELTIEVPNPFFVELLEDKYLDLIRSALYKSAGRDINLMYSVITDKTNNISINMEGSKRSSAVPAERPITNANKTPNPLQSSHIVDLDPRLNPKYNFENFVKGISNEFSRTVAESVAKNPAQTFNPLFIYGHSGVGKTHLVNAIGTRIKELYPQKRVLYVSANLFQHQYTDATINNKVNDFIRFYQSIDVLILDDVQEFMGMTKTQNTFFHIFNHLHQNGKQLIMTSDRAPVMLQGMEDRLLTRFKWGLTAELERPDEELRKNILLNKIRHDGLDISEPVLTFIAENVNESVRELEGIVNSMLAQSILFKREIDIDLAQRIIKQVVKCAEIKPVTLDEIIKKVCDHYKVETNAIQASSRKREVVIVRQVAMYLAKKYTSYSSKKIGKLIGNKDHATVLHACKTIQGEIDVNKSFQTELQEIESSLKIR